MIDRWHKMPLSRGIEPVTPWIQTMYRTGRNVPSHESEDVMWSHSKHCTLITSPGGGGGNFQTPSNVMKIIGRVRPLQYPLCQTPWTKMPIFPLQAYPVTPFSCQTFHWPWTRSLCLAQLMTSAKFSRS